jgi:hypothetical protein
MFASVPSGCRFAIGAISFRCWSEIFDETGIVARLLVERWWQEHIR